MLERELTRISAAYAAQPGSVDFYVLNNLPLGEPNDGTASDQPAVQKISNAPQTADLPATLKLSEKEFSGLKPVWRRCWSRSAIRRSSQSFGFDVLEFTG